MLRGTADELSNAVADQRTTGIVWNALIESFVGHARVLLYCFYPQRAYHDDVLASDFFDDPEQWNDLRPKLPAALACILRRANKEFAHLTYTRNDIDADGKRWQFAAISLSVDEVIRKFAAAVSSTRLTPAWIAL